MSEKQHSDPMDKSCFNLLHLFILLLHFTPTMSYKYFLLLTHHIADLYILLLLYILLYIL